VIVDEGATESIMSNVANQRTAFMIKQKKVIIYSPTSMAFLLFYSPKPQSHIRMSIQSKLRLRPPLLGDQFSKIPKDHESNPDIWNLL